MTLYQGYFLTNSDYADASCKERRTGLSNKESEKTAGVEEKAVHFLRKETEKVARDTAEELKRRKPIDHQWSFTTAMKELDRHIQKISRRY